MKLKTLLLIPALLCAGCETAHFESTSKADRLTTPDVKQYTPEQQAQGAKEMEKFCDKAPMLCQLVNDFGIMRDQARAALGIPVDVQR